MTLDGNVKIPLVGNVPKKAAAGGVAVVGVLIGVYYYRKRSAGSAGASAAAAATSTDQYPPDGTTGNPQDPYSTDPATGTTYGDEAAGSGGSYGAYGGLGTTDTGTYPWDGTVGNEADPYSEDPASGLTFGDEGLATGGTSANPTGGPPFANNSDWENWVVQQLQTNDPNVNQSDLTDALGLYLNGQPVSAAQKTLVFDATGVGGNPPIAGPNNYPPNVRTNGDTGPTTATVAVPNVVGQAQEAGFAILSAAGLKAAGSKTIAGKTLTVDKQSPAAGAKVAKGSTVTLTSAVKGGTTTTGAGTVKVPNVVGQEQSKAYAAISAAGLKPSGPAPVKGKVHTVTSQTPKAGTEAAKGSTVKLTSKTS